MTANLNKPSTLGFLISDISRKMRWLFNQRISQYGLTQAQWRAILAISTNPGSSQRFIAERLEIQPISLTRLMDRMERGGWIERRPDPEDRRVIRLYLTPKADPILNIATEFSAELLARACHDLSESDREQLLSLLEKVKHNLSS